MALASEMRLGFGSEDAVLRAERQADKRRFKHPQKRQGARKIEKETSWLGQAKPARLDQFPGLAEGQSLRVAIERNTAHDHTRAGIPRIIFEQREIAAWRKRGMDGADRLQAAGRRDVVEHSIHVAEIERG